MNNKISSLFVLFLLVMVIIPVCSGKDYEYPEKLDKNKRSWRFNRGVEFPGASGGIRITSTDKNGCLIIGSNFSKGGNYVGAEKKYSPARNIKTLNFDIMTGARRIGLRVVGADNQTHQTYIALNGQNSEWQPITFDISGENFKHHWGGAKDGIVRQPIKSLTLIVSSLDYTEKAWNTKIKNIVTIGTTGPQPELTATNPEQYFIIPNKKQIIRLVISNLNTEKKTKYEISDYKGKTILSGIARISSDQQSIEVPVELKKGLYELKLNAPAVTIGLFSFPPYQGKADQFFAIDGAFSCFRSVQDRDIADFYLKTLKRSGIHWIRDRIHWKRLERSPGDFDWQMAGNNGDILRQLCRDNGIKLLDTFHEAPSWAGSISTEQETYPYPGDLIATEQSWNNIYDHWSKAWGALEVWNEPEIGFGASLPGDHLCALQKTLSYVFAQKKTSVELCGGVFTGTCIEPAFLNIYLNNGLLEDSDIFCFHNYSEPSGLLPQVARIRDVLRKSPKGKLPFWITESGKAWPRGSYRAALKDDCASAFGIVMKTVEAKACGVKKFFPFVYCFYNENTRNFGMMDKNHSPMRSMAAYICCVYNLSGKQYVGDLKKIGCYFRRVFSDGTNAVVVAGTENFSKLKLNIPAGLKIRSIQGIDGRALNINGSTLDLSDHLVYIHLKDRDVRPFLNTSTSAMKQKKKADSFVPVPRKALPCVIQPDINLQEYPYTIYGYQINNPQEVKLSCKFNNLSDSPITIKPQITPKAIVSFSTLSTGELELPPRSTVKFNFSANLSGVFRQSERTTVKIYDASGHATPLVYTLLKGKKATVIGFPLNKNQKISGIPVAKTSEWIDFSGRSHWRNWGPGQGGPNISGKFRVYWNSENLQLQVLIQDHKFHQPFSIDKAWQGDSIQIAFFAATGKGVPQKFTEITAAQTPVGSELFRHLSAKGKKIGKLNKSILKFYAQGGKYFYVINLDAKEVDLPQLYSGMKLGLSLLINSNNGGGREGYLYWGDGIGVNKNPRELNILKLQDR